MEINLAGRRVLVTGSSSGIGAAVAMAMAQAGADVVVHYFKNKKGAGKTADFIKSQGRRTAAFQADLSEEGQAEEVVRQAGAALGGLDVLVNNAGVTLGGEVVDLKAETWRQIMGVNLDAPFFVTRAFLRVLRTQKPNPAMGEARAKIISITSVHQEIPLENAVAYCASKGGLLMFTRALALELAGRRINVNAIAPGWIEVGGKGVKENPAFGMARFPWGRAGKPEEVAKLAVYLASSAADYVTGSAWVIDGGMRQSVGLV